MRRNRSRATCQWNRCSANQRAADSTWQSPQINPAYAIQKTCTFVAVYLAAAAAGCGGSSASSTAMSATLSFSSRFSAALRCPGWVMLSLSDNAALLNSTCEGRGQGGAISEGARMACWLSQLTQCSGAAADQATTRLENYAARTTIHPLAQALACNHTIARMHGAMHGNHQQ